MCVTVARPAAGLVLTEVDGGVLVDQDGVRYKARKWRLTDSFLDVVDTAIENGFAAHWVGGHPSAPYLAGGAKYDVGSHHVTFARAHDEPWVFVLGAEARPPRIDVVTFNSKLVDAIHRTGVSYRWEHAGGHNVLVAPEHLRYLLQRFDRRALDEAAQAPARRRAGASLPPVAGLSTEYDLEVAYLRHLSQNPVAARRAVDVRLFVDRRYPDVVLDDADVLTIVELKFAHAGPAALDQLLSYMALPSIRSRAGKRALRGALIARAFAIEVVAAVTDDGGVGCYEYDHQVALHLKLVAGQDVLRSSPQTA